MSHVYLVTDTRERHVHGLIESLFSQAGAGQMISQINTGDYLICRRLAGGSPEILACIERKTLKDFAQSFLDGRYLNRNKMIDLRDKTGCQLYFFVEGSAFPKPTWVVAHKVVYGSILSAMTNMMIRDGIHVVQTENEMGTAQRLLDFIHAFEKTDVPYQYPMISETAADDLTAVNLTAVEPTGVPTLVMGTIEKSDEVLVTEMWSRLAGISLPTAQIIAQAFSVADLVFARVDNGALDKLRSAGGRKLAKKGRDSLVALKRGVRKEEIKILSGIPGISPAMATQVLAASSLNTLLALGQSSISAVTIRQKSRNVRLGDARAERIYRLMTFVNNNTDHDDGHCPNDGSDDLDQCDYHISATDTLGDDELDDLLGV